MLINKGYSAGDIVAFKLVSGDEIVAKIVNQSPEGFEINRPCTIVPSQTGLGFIQTLITADINTAITLKSEHVLMHGLVIQDIENHYIRTTTGIQTAKSGIIT